METLEEYICRKFKEIFNIDLNHEEYLRLNKNAKYASIIKSIDVPDRDIRKMRYLQQHMDILYDRKLSLVIQVRPSDNGYKILKIGNIITCEVISINDSGYVCKLKNYKNLVRLPLIESQPKYEIGKTVRNLIVTEMHINTKGKFNVYVHEAWVLKNDRDKYEGYIATSIDKCCKK